MYRIVIELPFNVLLVHKMAFSTQEDASAFIRTNYPTFPAMEVRTDEDIKAWKWGSYLFPACWEGKHD